MTQLLQTAIDVVQKLSPEQQDRIASMMLSIAHGKRPDPPETSDTSPNESDATPTESGDDPDESPGSGATQRTAVAFACEVDRCPMRSGIPCSASATARSGAPSARDNSS